MTSLRRIKIEISVAALLFFSGIIFGYFSAVHFPEISKIFEMMREIMKPVGEMSRAEMMLYILINNSLKTFLAIVLGVFLAIFPVFFLFSNGFIIGMLYELTKEKFGLLGYLLAILPHGILEIPALLISGALGIRMGYISIQALRGMASFREELRGALEAYLKLIFPLLLVASFIETFITTLLIGL
ncbi:MAG: stage sporulation protein [Archaeoglobi archaeon]|nr:stage II sporulation protein M [Candidatus Mnemosynella bozhongmuii]MDI3501918.1 stage sporulation protein [Archaeoglobi archaeon]MDK2781047.1 stage sporulation protein [Archaeoglobi archaeon]